MSDNLKLLKETSSKLRRPLLLMSVVVSSAVSWNRRSRHLPPPIAGGRGALSGVPPRESGGKVLVHLHGAEGSDDVGDRSLKFVS